jgi:hypothetical protein
MVQDASEHISLSTLWKYQKQAATITFSHARHLGECQDCVAVWIICRACKSLKRAETKLREHGIAS